MFDFFKSKKKDKEKEKEVKDKEVKKDVKKKPDAVVAKTAPEPEKTEKVKSEDFEVKDSLGKGSFGYVVLCRRIATNKFYAMKIVDKKGLLDHSRVQDVFTERNILTRANHPYLMKLHWTFQSESKVYFVMDYMPGGDLDKYMNSLPNKVLDLFTAKLYAMETLLAILFLHENKVIYRDLKPENVLLTNDGHCALADFGLSKDFNNEGTDADLRANSFVGSPFYVAPDVLRQTEYTDAVDFWSFGVLLFRMLCGRLPFTGKSMKEVFNSILYTNVHFPSSVNISVEAKDLIMRLLTKQPQRRLQGNAIKEHPFWEGMSWDDVMAKKVRPPRWTPIPKLEDLVDAHGNLPATQSNRLVDSSQSSAATAAQLTQTDQQLFGGFSYATDDPLN